MANYRVICGIVSARGVQTWIVKADSLEEAREVFESGEGAFESEEVEVTDTNVNKVELAEDVADVDFEADKP